MTLVESITASTIVSILILVALICAMIIDRSTTPPVVPVFVLAIYQNFNKIIMVEV